MIILRTDVKSQIDAVTVEKVHLLLWVRKNYFDYQLDQVAITGIPSTGQTFLGDPGDHQANLQQGTAILAFKVTRGIDFYFRDK
jgi:hypothetical protein